MAGSGRKNADDALLTALASGATIREAAERARLSERTVYRRLQDPAFRGKVKEARGEMVSRALGKLADGAAEAVDTLRGLLTAGSDAARLGAARCILETGNRLREAVELEARITELERRLSNELAMPR